MSQLENILSGNYDVIKETTSPLSRLWNWHLAQNGVEAPIWQARLLKHLLYVKEQKREKSMVDYKNNLLKALGNKKEIPWQRFCQGMGIFSPEGFEFTIELKLGDIELKKTVKIGHTYDEPRGEILKAIWDEITKVYSERMKDWKKLIDDYSQKSSKAKGKKNKSVSSNRKSGLAKSSITWYTFIEAVNALDFDVLKISVTSYDVTTTVKLKG